MKDLADAACTVVRRYYEEYNAFSLGMAERQIKQPEDVAGMDLLPPAAALEKTVGPALWDIYQSSTRCALEMSIYSRLERAYILEQVLSEQDVVRHAQRILTVWLLECCSFYGHPQYLPDLLAFDLEYLYSLAWVRLLTTLRLESSSLLPKSDRVSFSRRMADLFAASPGAARKGPSEEVVAVEYLATVGELERGVSLDSDVGDPMPATGAFRIGRYWIAPRGDDENEKPDTGQRSVLGRAKCLYNSRIVATLRKGKELHGLRKVIAIHFPMVWLAENRKYLMLCGDEKEIETVSGRPGVRLSEMLRHLDEDYEAARELRRFDRGRKRAIGQQEKLLGGVAKALLEIRYGYEMSSIARYVKTPLSDTGPTIRGLDPGRDWALIDEMMPKNGNGAPFPGCPYPPEIMAETPQAISCGIERDVLLRLIRTRPEGVTPLGPSHRTKRAKTTKKPPT